jgi:hypothetical protein
MKPFNLAVIVSAVILFTSGASIAGDSNAADVSNQTFTGQRPYMKAPTQDRVYRADDQWEGATLVTDINPDQPVAKKGHEKHQQMRLHMLGKRPYIEHPAD